MVNGEVAPRAAVLAHPAVACEHRAARDLAAVRVVRNAHVRHEPDHDRPRERHVLGAQLPFGVLDQLRLLLQEQHRCAPYRGDVDRLVRRVEDEHPATDPPTPLVLAARRGPCWRWWY